MPKMKAPCAVCPYKLGIIKTVVNPCPQCRIKGYPLRCKTSERSGKHSDENGCRK